MEWFLTQAIVATVIGMGSIFVIVSVLGIIIAGLVGSFNRSE